MVAGINLRLLRYVLFLVAVGVIVYLITNAAVVAETTGIQAQAGVAELSAVDFRDHIAVVTGWDSYPGYLYTPEDLSGGAPDTSAVFTDEHAASAQTGTHRLRLRLPTGGSYVVTFRSIDYATRVYIDGSEVGNAGVVGQSRETTTPRTDQLYFTITPEAGGTEIILQYANFVHKDGGRPPPLTIGSAENIARLTEKNVFSQSIIIGILLMAFLFHICTFFLYGLRREYLYFALTCLLFGLRSQLLIPLFFPEYNWYIAIRWEYIGVFTASLFMALFLLMLLPELLSRKIMLSAAALLAMYDVIIIVTQPVFFSSLVPFYQILCLLMMLYTTSMLAISLFRGMLQNLPAFVGMLLFTVLMISDTLALNNLPNLGSNNMLPTATVIFALAYMLMLTIDATRRERELQFAKSQAENQLALQTRRYEKIVEDIKHARQARHDLRHHLSAINAYIDKGDRAALEAYLAQYSGMLPEDDEPPVCDNHAVDAVASHYLARAKAAGAAIDTRMTLPQHAGIPDADLCVVFGNILENAAIAVERQREGRKSVKVICETDDGKIVLTVDNTAGTQEFQRDGIGLKSVAAVAERYGGVARFERSEGAFSSSVLLYIR